MPTYDFKVVTVTAWMDEPDLERRFNELGQEGYAIAAAVSIVGPSEADHRNNLVIFQRNNAH